MSSEGAAYQSSQQRHHHNMAFGKKQRYIEVFQCSGEDMNHVLTGGATQSAAASAASSAVAVGHPAVSGQTAGHPSPVKTSTHTTPTTGSNAATVAAVAAANGLLPPGMFTNAGAPHQSAATSHTQAGHTPFGHTAAGLAAADPNSAILAAAQQQMQSPFLQFAAFNQPPQPPNIRTTQADMVNLQNSQMAGLFSLANMQNHNMAAAAHAQLRPPQLTAAPALMAFNPLAQIQQQQLFAQQQQLLQHQLAAQRLMLTTPTSAAHPMHGSGQPGLIGPRPPPPPPQSNTHGFGAHAAIAHAQAAAAAAKRSFDQAFTAAGHDPTDPSKRASYGTPTISAGPTTYHSR